MPTIASMEPMLPDERQDLEDLATGVEASGLAGEGHNTLPIDIDRALKDDYPIHNA